MLYSKFQGYRYFGSGEVFIIYGNGGLLGYMTRAIWTNLAQTANRVFFFCGNILVLSIACIVQIVFKN